ncbi:cyclin-K isoform X2 [Thrips palmi]|uniref:Cyclin-K n=1 Tax=Thrips palmi TaxID=161013 RepID=A0A6P9A6S9_THRPL|nr:cyclin-K isoform X2 [Thrips palmi]
MSVRATEKGHYTSGTKLSPQAYRCQAPCPEDSKAVPAVTHRVAAALSRRPGESSVSTMEVDETGDADSRSSFNNGTTWSTTMPFWYYDKKEIKNSPSLQDGITAETESRYRKEGARFIIDTGTKMDLGYNTMATGVVYFHRFYMAHSFKSFPRYVTACCCLFLAGKVEETPKKCKDIIKIAREKLSDEKFRQFGEDPKEEVMTLERILLQTIKFDLQVEHPYGFLLKYAKSLKGDKAKLGKMVQMAWTFVNDSLCTTLCLQWEPEVIAVALMYLAGKLSKFEVMDWQGRTPKHLRWWDVFVEDVTMDLLEDICHQVLDLYSHPQGNTVPDSPPYEDTPVPALKKDRLHPQPISPAQHSHSPAGVPHVKRKENNDRSLDKLDMSTINYSSYNSAGPAFPPSSFPPSYPPAGFFTPSQPPPTLSIPPPSLPPTNIPPPSHPPTAHLPPSLPPPNHSLPPPLHGPPPLPPALPLPPLSQPPPTHIPPPNRPPYLPPP